MGEITGICIVGFIILGIYKIFELFVRRKERMAIIEKLTLLSEQKDLNIPSISFGKQDYGSWPLRIALLFIGVGLGCLTAFIIQHTVFDAFSDINDAENWHTRNRIYEITFFLNFSCVTIFGGLGLLIAYLIEAKQNKKQDDKEGV